jgi:hypothetical protein
MRSQLLCTFSNKKEYESTLIQVSNNHDILFDKIYILQNTENPHYLYLTYNVEGYDFDFLPKTISVHRKKHTNTLYTINALNELVMEKTGGKKDERYELDWDEYYNNIILTNDDGINIISTKLYKIINL